MTTSNILPDLERDEGCELTAKLDTTGHWFIGYGHTTPDVHEGMVWTKPQAYAQLNSDLGTTLRCLDGSPIMSPWWRAMDGLRQDVIVNMAFNLGVAKLTTFDTFLGFCRNRQYAPAAADESLTLWAKQVGDRAVRLSKQLETGIHQ